MLIDYDNHLVEGKAIVRSCKHCMGRVKKTETCGQPNHAITELRN